MSNIRNFHNKQSGNFSSFPYDSDPPMQRNQARENQQNLEDLLDQFKRKESGAGNPFYDNSYQHNLNVLPARGQDPSFDPSQQQYPSLSRDLDENPVTPEYERREPVQRQAAQEYAQPVERNQNQGQDQGYRDYDKKNLQDNNKGNFWGGLGENNRHKNIVKEYQEYMRNNPIPAPKKGARADGYEPERNRAPLKKKQDEEKEWYARDVGVGILPGMGSGNSRPRPAMQDGYGGYEVQGGANRRSPEREDYRRGTSDIAGNRSPEIPNKISHNPSGSRLAGIGSRLMDERPYYDQMRTPQFTPNKGDMKFNFSTPQDHRLPTEDRYRQTPGYSNERDRYNRQPEPILEVEEQNNQRQGEERWQNQGQQGGRDRRVQENNSGNNAGAAMSWVEERQRQEQDKKNRQRDDLQRIYREQIEEKKRKKEEEQRIKMLEDQKEEERLRKENEDLQKQYLMEQMKKKEQDDPKKKGKGEEIMDKDYVAARKRQNKHRQFEVSEASPMRRVAPVVPDPEPQEENRMIYEQEQVNVDYMIRETAKRYEEQLHMRPRYEFTKDPELEVHREFTRKINATLDEELEKMRKDVDYHSKLIRNELTSYKTQAMVTQELRENAHRELSRLKEELKNQQIMEERRPYDAFDFPNENPNQADYFSKGKERELDNKLEYKIGLQMPQKNYARSFSPDNNDGPDLGASSPGMDLDFDTKYVPTRDTGSIEARLFREPPKLNELMNKYGVDDDPSQAQQKKDLAMKKFGNLFPEHGGKPQNQDSMTALETRLGSNTYIGGSHQTSTGQQSQSYKTSNYDVEGEDEIERIENLLKMYKQENSMKDKEERKVVRREELQDYKAYEKAVMKEFGEEGFGGGQSFGYSAGGYGKDEDQDLNEGETPARSEVELANVTHEVSYAQDRLDVQGR